MPNDRHRRFLCRAGFACALLIALGSGCAGSGTQIAKLQLEKEQLRTRIAEEKTVSEQLAMKLREATDRAAEAERELALRTDGGRSNKSLVASNGSSNAAFASTSAWSLERLAQESPLLRFDPVRRTAPMKLDLAFSADDRLPFDSRRQLDKAADLLLSDAARRCGVTVTAIVPQGETETSALARANATADYLRLRGVSHDRVEVRRRDRPSLVDEEHRQLPTGGARTVELELMEIELTNRSTENIAGDSQRGDGWKTKAGRR